MGFGWLNDADGYQGGGDAGEKTRETPGDAEALFRGLKRLVKGDYNSP